MMWWAGLLRHAASKSVTVGILTDALSLSSHSTSKRLFTSSAPRHDVRRAVEGRFAKPEGGAAGTAAEEAALGLDEFPSGLPRPKVHVSPTRRRIATFFQIFLPTSGIACLWYGFTHPDEEPLIPTRLPPELQYLAAQKNDNQEVFTNWSGTHQAQPKRVLQPETEHDIEVFLSQASKANQKLRVVGSGLSPNGIAFSEEGMMSMALMDKVLKVDTDKKQVTVQAGCRVQQLADALAPHGLTLQNYASIREQQIGGFTQVSAHGTGARIPSVEEQVVSMRLVTPAMGTLTLSNDSEPELFQLAKVGLGALGVVCQVTLQCIPRHRLVERTFATNLADVKKNHVKWLQENQHLRYMWVPYTDTVIVVQVNPEDSPAGRAAMAAAANTPPVADAHRLAPLRELLSQKVGADVDIMSLSHTQLRDDLLAIAPTDKDWVARINTADAEVWRRTSGIRTGWSDEILGFDCGGQQWVHEVCFPVGKLDELKGVTKDIQYMETLLKEIKANKVAAHPPIEQRWSRGSTARLSPGSGSPDTVNSWVGVIMYLPYEQEARDRVTQAFRAYTKLVQEQLMPKYNAVVHWAKLEAPPAGSAEAKQLQARLSARYPLDEVNAYRSVLDPNNVLANPWVDTVLGGRSNA